MSTSVASCKDRRLRGIPLTKGISLVRKMMRKPLLLVQIALVVPAIAADLPIREVILYKHGVGYFERAGELRAGDTARLDFKASDMNDVLKSLTIVDRSGG